MDKNINIAEEIRSRADIVDIIGRTVKLKKSGSRWLGLCPFHNEKTPSFFVMSDSQRYYCFGCQKNGDVINFYEEMYNLDFLETCDKLAKELGIDWEPGQGYGSGSQMTSYYEVNKIAARYYYDAMFAKKNNPAFEYMSQKRGISIETIKSFGLGYAGSGKQNLVNHLKLKGINLKDAVDIGLLKYEKGEYRDKFFNRVIFPIINARDKVIGFGGRALGDGIPKYLNSDASPAFQKKDNLYALNRTGSKIRKANKVILVEGYMDVIALYDQGICNATAALGTSFTPEQAARLKKYTDEIILSFDSDSAGVKATIRAIDILREKGLKVRVLDINSATDTAENAKDPDEYIKKYGRAGFENLIKNAKPGVLFILGKVKEKFDLETTEGTIDYIRESADILRKLSPVEYESYRAIISKETGTSENAIDREIFGNKGPEFNRNKTEISDAVPTKNTTGESSLKESEASLNIQREILRLLIDDISLIEKLKGKERLFSNIEFASIFGLLRMIYAENPDGDVKIDDLSDRIEAENRGFLADILERKIAEEPEQQFEECLLSYEKIQLENQKKDLQIILNETNEDDEMANKILREISDIQKKIDKITQMLGYQSIFSK